MSEQQHKWSGQSVAGRYSLGNYLGGTDHSSVFATEIIHARTQRVAIKLIPAEGIVIARQLVRWKALSAISHPNLLKILDYGRGDLGGIAYLYVVMEHADEDLADILPNRALNAEETRAMMQPVIETLAFLHEQNLVHTRVHPGNILATRDQIKLSSDSISPKGESVSFGTAMEGFTPPEWGAVADSSQDIWSLGATVVAALTQRLELPANLPEPFGEVVRECLKKEPGQRISVGGIRSRLNPQASVPAIKETVPELKKDVPRIDPLAVPLSPIAPPVVPERHRDVRPLSPDATRKKSYFLPVLGAAAVLVLLLTVPKLFRQHSDAAPAETRPNTSSAEKAQPAKPLSSARATPTPQPKKDSSPPPALTETSQPSPTLSKPAVKAANKASQNGVARGEVLDQVSPDVSDKARVTIRGTVRISLRVHVNRGGTVDSAEPEPPAGSKYFTEQAIKAAKRWQFSAPEVNGQSVESDWLLHFDFTPSATNVRSEQVSP